MSPIGRHGLTFVPITVTYPPSAITQDLTVGVSPYYGESALSGAFGVTGRFDLGTTKKPPAGGYTRYDRFWSGSGSSRSSV